jgi:DDE domain
LRRSTAFWCRSTINSAFFSPSPRTTRTARLNNQRISRQAILSSTWSANHHHASIAGKQAGQRHDRVSERHRVQRFTPEFIEAARLRRHAPGDRWFADETYVKVAGRWTYLYRAIDQHGQVIDVLLSARRDLAAARRFFILALRAGTIPAEVTTDRSRSWPPESAAAADARTEASQVRTDHLCRARVRAEHPPWSL